MSAFLCELQHETTTYGEHTRLVDYLNPALFITLANKEDHPTLKEAMNGPDAKGFFKAMEIEINQLAKMKAFVVVERTSSMNVISSAWALRRKRYPDGSIRKIKA